MRTKLEAYIKGNILINGGVSFEGFEGRLMNRLHNVFLREIMYEEYINTGIINDVYVNRSFRYWLLDLTPKQLESEFNSHEIVELFSPEEELTWNTRRSGNGRM